MSKAFDRLGYDTYSVDWNASLQPDIVRDISKLKYEEIEDFMGGQPGVIWASPDCTKFSWASGAKNEFRKANKDPLSNEAKEAIMLVEKTIEICKNSKDYWFIENPSHGALEKLDVLKGIPMMKVAHCNYGYKYQKFTNIWGRFPPTWNPKGWCGHLKHPNIKFYKDAQARAEIPPLLCQEIADACYIDNGTQVSTLMEWI